MTDFDDVRRQLDSEDALAALDRIEAEHRRFQDALERILAAPLRSGRWYRAQDSPRIIARLALAAGPGREPTDGSTGPPGVTADTDHTAPPDPAGGAR